VSVASVIQRAMRLLYYIILYYIYSVGSMAVPYFPYYLIIGTIFFGGGRNYGT